MDKRGNNIKPPPGKYHAAGLAKVVGVSPDTVRRWRELGRIPYSVQDAGRLTVYVFGKDALIAARKLKASRKPGSGLWLKNKPVRRLRRFNADKEDSSIAA